MSALLCRSRFTQVVDADDGGLIAYNSLTGNTVAVSAGDALEFRNLLSRTVINDPQVRFAHAQTIAALTEQGFLVPCTTDEKAVAADLRNERVHRSNILELIVMPTEACNFRCTYCYEDFTRGRMSTETQRGLEALVNNRGPGLDAVAISWFGGEPLIALDIIEDLTSSFVESGRRHDFAYAAGVTTNGYLLTADVFRRCLDNHVTRFQITLDGPAETHNRTRILLDGDDTFDTIHANLITAAATDADFHISLSTNFTTDNVDRVAELLDQLSGVLAGDERFSFLFRPVGKWGGPRDSELPVCTGSEADLTALGLYRYASSLDLDTSRLQAGLQPGASICYAANPWSLVVRSGGELGKCTVAIRDPINQLGRILDDGELDINEELLALWTNSDESTEKHCQACYFRPSCQGAYCPLKRIQDGQRPCPPAKVQIRETLRTVAASRQHRHDR